jgi:hypothetical protein
MWAALALTTAAMSMAPAQGGDLKLTNVRATYGILGPERKDTKMLPGDVLYIAYDIENVKVKDDGRVLYSMGMEVRRKGADKEKPMYKSEPQDLIAVNRLGGTTLPAFAMSVIGVDQKEGDYQLKITVKDRSANKTATLTKDFQIAKPAFGLVRVRWSNSNHEPAPPIGVPGQRLHLNVALAGFKTDKKLPNVTFEMQIYDSNGKATLKEPYKGDIKKESPEVMIFQPIEIDLNRAGKFKVTIKATDNNAKKTVEQSLDLTVLDK